MAIEMKKPKVKMNKPIYLGISILDIRKTLVCEFWYDYIKPKYQDKVKNGFTHLTIRKMIKGQFQQAKTKK